MVQQPPQVCWDAPAPNMVAMTFLVPRIAGSTAATAVATFLATAAIDCLPAWELAAILFAAEVAAAEASASFAVASYPAIDCSETSCLACAGADT